jgi:hypothetical protein
LAASKQLGAVAKEGVAMDDNDRNSEPKQFHYSSLMFFKAMLLIAWCSIRHPLSTTIIDLETGRILPKGE